MSEHVTLSLRGTLAESIDLDCVSPVACASMTEREIAELPVWAGRAQHRLGDYFDIRGHRSSAVRIVGDVRHGNRIGAGMTGGSITVDGGVGVAIGVGMSGGSIDVHGSAGDDLGRGMSGGWIRARGDAGNRPGAGDPGTSRGITGGEIVIDGSAGSDVGARMRRGLIFVAGNAGTFAARSMIAGTVIVAGAVGADPAFASKRGSLVVGGSIDVPVTYRHACDYEPPHIRLALTHLARRHGTTIDRALLHGRYRRYCGDASTIGRGEILQLLA